LKMFAADIVPLSMPAFLPARSSRAGIRKKPQSGELPSMARRRALRSGYDSLCAPLRPPLHLPRSPTTDRSQVLAPRRA
jgi:hypothetical protein